MIAFCWWKYGRGTVKNIRYYLPLIFLLIVSTLAGASQGMG